MKIRQNAKAIFSLILQQSKEEEFIISENKLSRELKLSRYAIREVLSVARLIGAISVESGNGMVLVNKKELQFFYDRYLKEV